jgi:hypothetical protein
MITIYDDFLNTGYYNEIESLTMSGAMDWHFLNNISYKEGHDQLEHFGYFHELSVMGESRSRHLEFIKPLLLNINYTVGGMGWMRSRLDMTTYTGKTITHDPHIDYHGDDKMNVSCVFYIGQSDGNTIIYNEVGPNKPNTYTTKQEIEPKPNRLVCFSGNYWHTGQSPLNNTRRVILNSNYIINSDNAFSYNKTGE